MPENSFIAVRDHYEDTADQPPFDVLLRRRRRRTHRHRAAGAAALALVVAAGVATIVRIAPHGPDASPTGPASSTAAPSASAPVGAGSTALDDSFGSLAIAPSGTLYGLRRTGATTVVLDRGTGEVPRWTDVGVLAAGPDASLQLVVADNTTMWVLDAGRAVQRSTDGGRTWHVRPGFAAGPGNVGPRPGYADGTLWYGWNGTVFVDRANADPASYRLPGIVKILSIAPIDADHAILVGTGAGGHRIWRRTADRGAHWTAMPNACRTGEDPTLDGAPGGLIWVICQAVKADVNGTVNFVRHSGDSGLTWTAEQPFPIADAHPALAMSSATRGWMTSEGPDVFHTTDGSNWTGVAVATGPDEVQDFTANGPDVAAYLEPAAGDVLVTTDGGQTWSGSPYPK